MAKAPKAHAIRSFMINFEKKKKTFSNLIVDRKPISFPCK